MLSLAKLSIRRPKAALAAWLLTAGVLTLIGFGVSKTLSPTVTVVPGTQSSRAEQLAKAQFGPTQLVPILLEGPKAQLDRQGPKLVVALSKRPYTRVLSAWDAGTASAGLRPKATAAMIVVSVDRTEQNVVKYDQPQIENLVAHRISGPVKSYVTGQPSIDRADRDASLSNLRSTEAIAIGALFLLLLVGLRAPVAAAIVTAVGGVSMLSGFGEVALLGKFMSVDPVAVALGTMTGLALGVGFALLILDRFHREEWPDGVHSRDAAGAALRELETTGKAVLVGGTAVALALGLVALIGPTQLMVSLGTGMLTCALFATGAAVVVMPAALVLLGRRIDAFSFPAPAPLSHAWSRLVSGGNWVTKHAVYAGFAATAVLAAVAIPAFALKTGPQDISQLPAHSQARTAFQEVSRVMGPGWPTPYNLVVVARSRPITTPSLLAGISGLQQQIARDKTVESVTGPAAIRSSTKDLSQFWPGIKHSVKISDQSKKDLLKLINGLGLAGSGASQLQSGLAQAASGAGQIHGGNATMKSQLATAASGAKQLHTGSGAAQSGAGQLHSGLAQAQGGSTKLTAGLNQALAGAQALKNGAAKALAGSSELAAGLGKGAPQVKAGLPAVASMASNSAAAYNGIVALMGKAGTAQGAVSTAVSELRAMGSAGKGDPHYQAVLGALQNAEGAVGGVTSGLSSTKSTAGTAAFLAANVKTQVDALAPQLTTAATGAAQLADGIAQLRTGNAQLANGMAQLAGGGGQLNNGLGQLTDGAGQLQAGLALITNGTGQLATGLEAGVGGAGLLANGAGELATGLSGGVGPAGQLVGGLGQMQAGVVKARGQIPSTAALKKLEQQAPGLFSSGYFVLAAVEGSRPADRNAATFTINVLRGGSAAQIMVVSKYKVNDPRTDSLGTRLAADATKFAGANNTQVAVGGPAGNLLNLTSVTEAKIWVDVAVIAAALALVLALALRAIVLPIVATAFGLLATAATFGIIQLLFGGSNPPLGGPGYLDPATIIGVFTVAFSITVVYSALLLMRTREAYLNDGHSRSAVRTGLRETAAAATGAGFVVVASVIPFVTADFMYVRAFGIGVAVAVLLDLLIVRPVLLPAGEAVLGRFGWWPTTVPRSGAPSPPSQTKTHRMPWLHMPHRPAHPAHR